MKSLFRLALLSSFVLVQACLSSEIGHSKDVAQKEIHQSYFIRYSAEDDQTEVTAFFRFAGPSGTTLILDRPSKIELNGERLAAEQTKMAGAFYTKTEKGKFPDGDYLFQFTDLDEKQLVNKLTWRNMSVVAVPDSFTYADGLTISFAEHPAGNGEEIIVEIADTAQSVRLNLGKVRKREVKIDGEELQALRGRVSIHILRRGNYRLRHTEKAGGTLYTEYELKPLYSYIRE